MSDEPARIRHQVLIDEYLSAMDNYTNVIRESHEGLHKALEITRAEDDHVGEAQLSTAVILLNALHAQTVFLARSTETMHHVMGTPDFHRDLLKSQKQRDKESGGLSQSTSDELRDLAKRRAAGEFDNEEKW